jgi:hypothetical protein
MKRSSELRELIVGYFESFTVGDPDWVDRHVLNGPELRLIGTGHDEWLDGVGGFSVFQQESAGATGALSAEVSDIEAYSEGDVGWGAALVRFTLPNGQWARSRFSVVFVDHDGTWKVVSAHNSIAVADEDAFASD